MSASAPTAADKSTPFPDGNLLLRASAGTGKTHQLVERYVDLVLRGGLSPAQVVVITFTRKAASELRQRIERRLREAGAAGEVLAALPTAPIDNFHGLCLGLLRGGFGSTLQQPTQPDVLGEEGEDRQLFAAAAQSTWLTQPALAEDVATVAGSMGVDEEALGVLWSALARAREDGRDIDDALWGEDYDPVRAQQKLHVELLARRQRVADGAHLLTTDAGRAKLAAFLAAPVPSPDAPAPVWVEGWDAVWSGIKRQGNMKLLIEDGAREEARALAATVLAEASCVALQPSWRRLLGAAWQAYAAAKTRQHCRDYADIVAEVVAKLRADPALHQAVRRQVGAVLVDEAQDTNTEQRVLVHLLVGLRGPAAAAAPQARLLVVGDWKQCIYTFRGADPRNFRNFAEDVQRTGGRDETLEHSYRSRPALVAGINALGRQVFGGAYEPLVAREAGAGPAVAATQAAGPSQQATANAAALPAPTPPSQPASFHPALADGMHWLPVPGPDEKKQPSLEEEAERVADVVAQTLASGVAPHEVAVLLAGLRAKAATLVAALAARGIDAVTSGGGALYAREEVRQLLSLLAYLADESCALPAAVALRSPLLALPDAALWALFSPAGRAAHALAFLRRGEPGPALATLGADAETSAVTALHEAARLLPQLVAAVGGRGPLAACQAVGDLLDLRALWLGGPEGAQRLANFERVLALAARAEHVQKLPAAAFALQQLARMQAGLVEAEGAVSGGVHGAVTLSTVHKSKGLQWRVVVLAGLARARNFTAPPILYHREHRLVFAPQGKRGAVQSRRYRDACASAAQDDAEQLRRLLYVAVTRAKERVVFVAPATGGGSRGFFGLLAPWQRAMPAELNLLRPEDVPVALPDGPPTADVAAQARNTQAFTTRLAALAEPRALPPETSFHVTVTDLARELPPPAAGAQPPRPQGGVLPVAAASSAGWTPPESLSVAAQTRRTPSPPLATLVAQATAAEGAVTLDPQALGSLVHEVLAHWSPPQHINEAADAAVVEAWLRHRGLASDAASYAQVRGDLLAFGRSPLGMRLRGLGAAARRHELPFALEADAAGVRGVLRGQIDLLAWDDGAPWVVDFKYALRRPDEADYLRQLDAYAWAAAELCGHRGVVRCHLVYLREANVVTEHVATFERQAAVRARLEAWVAARASWPRHPSA